MMKIAHLTECFVFIDVKYKLIYAILIISRTQLTISFIEATAVLT